MSRNNLTFPLIYDIINYKLKGVGDVAIAFGKVYTNDNYVSIDLDKLYKRIQLSRLQECGGMIGFEERITPMKDEFLIMSEATLNTIKTLNEVVGKEYGAEPNCDFLFSVPIAICNRLEFGHIKYVHGDD